MVTKNTKLDANIEKKYGRKDTSYSSVWLFNKETDLKSIDLRDKFVNFYDEKDLLSEFNPTVSKNIISYWSKECDVILDPFAGRTRAIVAYAMNRKYRGYEVSKDAHGYLMKRMEELGLSQRPDFDVTVKNADCINMSKELEPNSADLIFTCPPYWNLEKYESCDGQLSDIDTYSEFLKELKLRLNMAADVLKEDAYMCVVVGDMRRKKKFYPFHLDVMVDMSFNRKLKFHDLIVIQNIPFNTAAFYFGNSDRFKRTAKCHEYLLIWKKVKEESLKEISNPESSPSQLFDLIGMK